MTDLIIHGHFYQPPRENPWTAVIDPEPTAAPFQNWNERIHAECYQPNSAVKIVRRNPGEERVVNNYAHISFDFGPTLLSWLERNHAETYERIITADAESAARHHGHGNAIAQAYNHAILPLCNSRDRRTQVRWGMADFRHRFRRAPEAMWLPETACNDDVLDLLIEEGLRFVILAPQQAARVRRRRTGIPACPFDTDESLPTTSLADEQGQTRMSVLPGMPYSSFHRDGSGRSIAVFFYDQQLAHAIAFEQALASSSLLVERFVQQRFQTPGLINIATDGETYGHHHKFGELCLAYTLEVDAPDRGFEVTNYGEYLDRHPPEIEVQISNGPYGEGSSWSCTHGVSRWIRDCGCHTGGAPGWNQSWRKALRDALDFLRDEGEICFESTRGKLFIDPWSARDAAITLILDERESREAFLALHASGDLRPEDQRRALLHLELQRNLMLMYTSCAWFFNDISGIEPVQILKYACRAIDLMDQLDLPTPRARFLEILGEAKSNRPEMGTGADIYRRLVEPVNPSFKAEAERLAGTIA
jgi:alpha-amylase/alpha-mannosidase (GH57 family)